MTHHRFAATFALAVLAATAAARAQDPAPPSPAERFAAVQQRHQQAMQAFEELYQAAKTDEDRQAAFAKYPRGDAFVADVKTIVEQSPQDAVAVEAINWLLPISNGNLPELDQLLDLLLTHHLDDAKLADTCQSLQYSGTPNSVAFLRTVLAKSPHKEAQGRACYVLAKRLEQDASLIRRLQHDPDPGLVEWLTESRGAAKVDELKKADPAPLCAESKALLERVVADYADLESYQKTLGEQAKGDLFELENLVVGKVAPDIEGTDVDGVPFKLSDYRGKVIFLDFWGFW